MDRSPKELRRLSETLTAQSRWLRAAAEEARLRGVKIRAFADARCWSARVRQPMGGFSFVRITDYAIAIDD